jgi:hypothetical protein
MGKLQALFHRLILNPANNLNIFLMYGFVTIAG